VLIRPNTPRPFGQFGNLSVNHFRDFDNDDRFRRFHDHDRFRRNVVIWPWWGWGGWGWDSNYNNNDYDTYLQQQASYNQQLALQGQLQYMQQQLAELRQDQQAQRDYAESQSAQAPASSAAPAKSQSHDNGPPTTLVFRDGKRVETQNYAIVGNTLWLMADNGHMQKVLLSELDREATLKSNEDRGVDFRVPQQ
jgi:hypothetical protein